MWEESNQIQSKSDIHQNFDIAQVCDWSKECNTVLEKECQDVVETKCQVTTLLINLISIAHDIYPP